LTTGVSHAAIRSKKSKEGAGSRWRNPQERTVRGVVFVLKGRDENQVFSG
jgi:hypothetical protein